MSFPVAFMKVTKLNGQQISNNSIVGLYEQLDMTLGMINPDTRQLIKPDDNDYGSAYVFQDPDALKYSKLKQDIFTRTLRVYYTKLGSHQITYGALWYPGSPSEYATASLQGIKVEDLGFPAPVPSGKRPMIIYSSTELTFTGAERGGGARIFTIKAGEEFILPWAV